MTQPSARKQTVFKAEDGVVAIVVALIVTIIISVITISFARIMRREQRQALDRQLNTQAFYAAEAAANYAIKNIDEERSDCALPAGYPQLDPTNSAVATCLLIDDSLAELVFDGVNTNEPTIFNINAPVDTLNFNWENASSPGTWQAPATYPKFLPATSWGTGTVGVVEVIVYPLRATIDRDYLIANSKTFYLYPTSGGSGTVAWGSSAGEVVRGHCDNGGGPKLCRASVTGVPGVSDSVTGYVMRLRAIYNPLSVSVNGENAGVPVTLSGTQRLIDVTARASDVRRRIQIRLPRKPSYNLPIYAIEAAGNLCKRLEVYPAGATDFCDPTSFSPAP